MWLFGKTVISQGTAFFRDSNWSSIVIRSVPSLELQLRCFRSSWRLSQKRLMRQATLVQLLRFTQPWWRLLCQCSGSTEGQSLNVKTLQDRLISIRGVAEWHPQDLKSDLYLPWLHPHQQRNQRDAQRTDSWGPLVETTEQEAKTCLPHLPLTI